MKYVVVLGDGMANWPIEKLGGKTALNMQIRPIWINLLRTQS